MARSRGRRFAPTARRKLIWARDEDTALSPVPATGQAHDLLAQFRTDGGSTLGCTVTRVRVDLRLEWLGLSRSSALTLGVIVDQLQSSVLEPPAPGEEPHADWMYWRRVPQIPEFSAALQTGDPALTVLHTSLVLDVRSQRKMEELGQTVYICFDPTLAGAGTLGVSWGSSVLLKLP